MNEELIILGGEEQAPELPVTVTDKTKPKAPPPIEMVYRQVYDSLDSRLVGFEAQTRINDRKLGTLLPSLFLPIAERSNQVIELGKWSFVEMADMIRRQREKGRVIECMFMPVSVKYFCSRYFINNLTRALTNAGMQSSEICIMLEASALLEADHTLRESIAKLREKEIPFGIVGVGREGVSLLQIGELAPKYIELDAAFSDLILNDEKAKDVGNSFAEMCTRIGATLIADGIDSKEHAAALQAIGCSLMQGTYFANYVREDKLF